MRRPLAIAVMLASLGLAAHADEGDVPARTKSAVATALASTSLSASAIASSSGTRLSSSAPFTASGRDPLQEMLVQEDPVIHGPQGACENSARDVCYDLAERRIVFRPARRYMPKVGDLTPESVSLRPNRILLKYSFK